MARDFTAIPPAKVTRTDRAVADDLWIKQMLDHAPVGYLATILDGQPFINSNLYVYDEAAGGGDLIRMLLEEHPIPIRERRRDVPAPLAAVIEKCLARDPKERYPDAATMRRALKPFC